MDQATVVKFLKPLTPWADTEEDLKLQIRDGEYVVTDKGRLMHLFPDDRDSFLEEWLEEGEKVVASVDVGNGNLNTYRLRQYCEEFHPDVDFTHKFETWHSGVFERYHEEFGYDYTEWVQEQIYNELVEALEAIGYRLPFAK